MLDREERFLRIRGRKQERNYTGLQIFSRLVGRSDPQGKNGGLFYGMMGQSISN